METGLTAKALLLLAAEHGYTVSATQLTRWHRADLLPRPVQRSRGRHGTESWYPADTDNQLLALCALHIKKWRLEEISWSLWWAGYQIPTTRIRAVLANCAAQVAHIQAELVDSSAGHLRDTVLDFCETNVAERLHRQVVRRARKRVTKKQFSTFIWYLLEIAGGIFEGYGEGLYSEKQELVERALLEDGLGLTRARIDRIGEVKPWLTEDTTGQFQAVSRLMNAKQWQVILDQSSDEAIARVRDQTRELLVGLGQLIPMMELMWGRGSFGFAGLADSLLDVRRSDQAILLLFLLTATHVSQGNDVVKAIEQLIETITQAVVSDLAKYEALQQLRTELPAFSDILSPQNLRKVQRSEKAKLQHLTQLQRLYEEQKEALEKFKHK